MTGALSGENRLTPQSSWADLYAARNQPPYSGDPALQNQLALYEHQAWARENAMNDPSLLYTIPGYSAAKGLGLMQGRTPGSWDEVVAGYRGLLEGLQNSGYFRSLANSMLPGR